MQCDKFILSLMKMPKYLQITFPFKPAPKLTTISNEYFQTTTCCSILLKLTAFSPREFTPPTHRLPSDSIFRLFCGTMEIALADDSKVMIRQPKE